MSQELDEDLQVSERTNISQDTNNVQDKLFQYIADNKLEAVKTLLKKNTNIDISAENLEGDTPLCAAASRGYQGIVKVLLDSNKRIIDGSMALFVAASNSHPDVVNILLKRTEIDVNKAHKNGATVLYEASRKGQTAIVKALVKCKGIDVNNGFEKGATPLYVATCFNHIDIVNTLLECSEIDVNKAENNTLTPLYAAASRGYLAIVKTLLDANKEIQDGTASLFVAISNNHLEIVKTLLHRLLIDMNKVQKDRPTLIDVNKVQKDRPTPLYEASRNGNLEMVRELLKTPNIDVNKGDTDGASALYVAACCNHLEIVNALLECSEIDVNKAANKTLTPLYAAASRGYLPVVKTLLDAPGIDVNNEIEHASTPLFAAASNNHLEITKALLSSCCIDVNKAHTDGSTPLHEAARKGHLEIVKVLLTAPGIDVSIAPPPLDASAQNNDVEMTKELLAYINVQQGTPLFYAAQEGHNEVMEVLLATNTIDVNTGREKGVDVNTGREKGVTPLLIAAANNRVEAVKVLLTSTNIKVDTQTKFGVTPLYAACYLGHTQVVDALLKHPQIDVNQKLKGQTVLMKICGYAQDEKEEISSEFSFLLRNGQREGDQGDIAEGDDYELTKLQVAGVSKATKVIEMLLSCEKINLDAKDEMGRDALFYACKYGRAEFVNLLLKKYENNPPVHLTYEDGRTHLLQETIETKIDLVEKLEHLFAQENLEPNLKGQVQFNHGGFIDHHHHHHHHGHHHHPTVEIFKGNVVVASILNSFKNNDLACLKTLFQVAQKYSKTFEIEIKDDSHKYGNILDWLVFYNKYSFVAVLFGGLWDGLISHNNLQFFISAIPTMLENKNYYHILANFVENKSQSQDYSIVESTIYNNIKLNLSKKDIKSVSSKVGINAKAQDHLWPIEFKGNVLAASVAKNFQHDNVNCLKQLFKIISNSSYNLDITIGNLSLQVANTYTDFGNILDVLVYFKKYSLVSMLYQGIYDGQVIIDQLGFFVRAIKDMVEDFDGFEPILTNFLENEQVVYKRALKHGKKEINIHIEVLDFLREIIVRESNYRMFQSIFVQSAVDQVWTQDIQIYYYTLFGIFTIYFILFLSAICCHIVWTYQKRSDEFIGESTAVQPILWATLPFVIFMLIAECLQINYDYFENHGDSDSKQKSKNEIIQKIKQDLNLRRKIWQIFRIEIMVDILDWFIIVMGIVFPFVWSPQNDSLMSLSAVFIFVLFFRLTFWLLLVGDFGHYILMMGFITSKTIQFVIILLIMVFSFTLSFTLIFQNLEEVDDFDKQLFVTSLGLFGNIELDNFFDVQTPYKETGLFLLSVFIVLFPVLIINLLIAIMTSIYDEVCWQQNAAFYRNKALIVLEAAQFFENIKKIFPCCNKTQKQNKNGLKIENRQESENQSCCEKQIVHSEQEPRKQDALSTQAHEPGCGSSPSCQLTQQHKDSGSQKSYINLKQDFVQGSARSKQMHEFMQEGFKDILEEININQLNTENEAIRIQKDLKAEITKTKQIMQDKFQQTEDFLKNVKQKVSMEDLGQPYKRPFL